MTLVLTPQQALDYVWLVWVVTWFAAALWSNRTVGRPGAASQLTYRLLTLIGTFLLFGFHPGREVSVPQVWQIGPPLAWSLVAIAALGLAFSWWARLHLGRLWSGTVTRKEDHRVVDTGPYALVRHPIYTGVITATLATAALRATTFAFAGMVIMTAGWVLKARLEERFLREQLGAEAYDAYARRVPMLVPFWPR